MGPFLSLFRFLTKSIIEGYVKTATSPAIKNSSFWDRDRQHLFKTHNLGAKRDHVTVVELRLSPFVFHWKRLPGIFVDAMELHHISLTNQAKFQRAKRNAIFNTHATAGLTVLLVNPLMHDATLGS